MRSCGFGPRRSGYISAEETETGAREDLRLQPENLGASSEMTIGGPRNEPDGPPTSLGATILQ